MFGLVRGWRFYFGVRSVVVVVVNVTNKANSKGAAMIEGVVRDLPPNSITIVPRSSCCGSRSSVPLRVHGRAGFSRPSTFS